MIVSMMYELSVTLYIKHKSSVNPVLDLQVH